MPGVVAPLPRRESSGFWLAPVLLISCSTFGLPGSSSSFRLGSYAPTLLADSHRILTAAGQKRDCSVRAPAGPAKGIPCHQPGLTRKEGMSSYQAVIEKRCPGSYNSSERASGLTFSVSFVSSTNLCLDLQRMLSSTASVFPLGNLPRS